EEGNGPIPKGVWSGEEYDGYRGGCRLGRESRHLSADGNNEGHLPMHERGRKRRQPVVLTICPAVVDHDVRTLDKASFVQSLANDGDRMRIGSGRTAAEESNHRQPTLLRARRQRPRGRRAAEQRDERAALHSITSSARADSAGETSRPSALAVLRLITSSNLVDCCTGKSVGFSPLRILPVYTPMRRWGSLRLVP